MPAWLQIALGVASLVVVLSQVIARWGGRAARQDVDAAALTDAARAVQRHETSDATMSQTITTIARGVERMEARLDRLAEGHAEAREARVRTDGEVAALRESHARHEVEVAALRAEIRRVDESQTAARHALRGEIQSWVHSGIGDALKILDTLVGAGGGGGGTGTRAGSRR